MSHVARFTWIAGTLCAAALACGEGEPGGQRSSIARALERQEGPAASTRKAEADMRKLKAKVEAEREATILAEIDRVTAVPAAPPAGSDPCGELRGAFDGFVQARLAGDLTELERWAVMKSMELDPLEEACRKQADAELAACQARAFRDAPLSVGRSRSQALLDTCARKLGVPVSAPTGALPPGV